MRTTIKAKVHLLATGKKISHGLNTGDFAHSPFYNQCTILTNHQNLNHGDWVGQHLYFTTDEEPKKGDWCVDIQAGTIFTMGGALETYPEHLSHMKKAILDNAAKIVATTNPELWFKTKTPVNECGLGSTCDGDCIGCKATKNIPKIDVLFIEAYIKAYNEGKPITEVLLEQELFITDKVIDYLPEKIYSNEYKLKLKPNGSVIVHPVKERMYTRKELYTTAYLAFVSGFANPQLKPEELEPFLNDWFNKNYPE